MKIRHISSCSFLLALPVALLLPAYAQEAPYQAEPQQEPQQEQAEPMPPPPQAPAQRGGWQRFNAPPAMTQPALPMQLTIPAGT